jgi:predicted O-methyltransferase YrrM
MNTGLIFFRIFNYLNYILVSLNRKGHGIHSPFVFDIVNRVFRNKSVDPVVNTIENIRKKLRDDKRIIDVRDFGTGSNGQGNNLRRVSEIARDSPVPEKYGKFLANMAAEYGRPMVIEFGTSFGVSTMYMASSVSETPVFSMEGCPAIAGIAESNFRESGLRNITLKVGSFEESIPEIVRMGITPGLVFIDGNHRKKPLLGYFEKMAEISGNDTVIIIDDINYSSEMKEAWNEIRHFGLVTLTIDLYRMGIVYFRKGISRNNYIIRY